MSDVVQFPSRREAAEEQTPASWQREVLLDKLHELTQLHSAAIQSMHRDIERVNQRANEAWLMVFVLLEAVQRVAGAADGLQEVAN